MLNNLSSRKLNLVSVLIPCHNAGRWIGEAIDSVLAQTWSAVEIVIVNDGSTDNSLEEIDRFADSRIKLISPPRPLRSAAKARNLAFECSRGCYIKYFDADDILHPQMIEKQMETLAGDTDAVASAEWGRFYNDDKVTFKLNRQSVWRDMSGPDWLAESWMDARPMMQPGIFLIPRQQIVTHGGWDEELSLIDDFEFFARILASAARVLFTPGVPLMYRSGLGGSLSSCRTEAAVLSAYNSVLRGTFSLLKYRDDSDARLACANVMQDFVYTYFPQHRELRKEMMKRISAIGGSNLPCRGSPRFNFLSSIVGWRLAKRVEGVARALRRTPWPRTEAK